MKKNPSYNFFPLVLLASIGVLVVLTLIIFNIYTARLLGGGGDFLLSWKAARAFLFERTDPYGGTVARFVQNAVYGRLAGAGENHYVLDLPFHLLLLYFPFGLLRDAVIARGVWLFLSEAALVTLAMLSLRLTDWRPRRFFLILFFLFVAFGFYSLDALLESTPVIFLGLIYAGILFSLRHDLDELTGALIALAFYQWEVGGLFLFFIIFKVIQERRRRVFAGFFMLTIPLLVISFFVYPGWLLPFARGAFADWRLAQGLSTGSVFSLWWPGLGNRLSWVLAGVLLAVLIAEWSAVRLSEFNRFHWTACLTLAITPLFGFRSELQNLIVLLPSLALIFAVTRERWKIGYWLTVTLLVLAFGIPWVLVANRSISFQMRADLLFLFLPVFTVLGLYWIRWWAIRPPRTWFERATRAEFQ